MNRRSFLAALSLAPVIASSKFSLSERGESYFSNLGITSASMWTYLWDIVDEGYDDVLQRLKDNGLTSISLATAYHTGKFLAPHNPRKKVVFLEDGTVYFQPNPKLYGTLQPLPNTLVKEGHSLATVKKHADAKGLQTRSWVVCCHNTRLGMLHPEIACETVFGDTLYHNLCPSNAEVRKYIRALVKDIASYGVDAIELEALQFQGYAHGTHHEREGIELNQAMRFLLGLCFCPSCTKRAQGAHVDVEAVRKFVKSTLESHFEKPGSLNEQYPTLDALPKELFDPFLEWRKSVVVSFVEELAHEVRSTKLRPMMSVEPLAQKMVSTDPARVAKATGGVLAIGYVKDGNALRGPLSNLQSLVGNEEITVGFQAGLPESGGKVEFLDRIKVARELGVNGFNFYNYGFIPYQNLTWIKEALAS